MSPPVRGRRRLPAMAAAAALCVALAGGAGLASPAAAAVGECPPGTIPGPGSSNPIWTDNNVAVYAGGDLLVRNAAAELEGLAVIAGDADFAKTGGGTFNVGWVGVGSGVAPSPGEVMLAVGGDLSVGAGTVLDVGANAVDAGGALRGGDVHVGGATDPDYETDGSRYRLNNGALRQGMDADALAPWATWGADISAESADFAARPNTGTAAIDGAFLVFTGDGSSTQQVFTVPASVLTTGSPALDFRSIPAGASVIVNVGGGGDVVWAPNYFADGGVRADDPASPLFGVVSARTLWNFPTASSLHLGGTSQVLGTILLPTAGPGGGDPAVRVTASTNGRLYTNGTILMDGTGNEHHNYPWVDAPFECIPDVQPDTGAVTIAKAISPEDAALLPDDIEFSGVVVCDNPDGSESIIEWTVVPGGSVTVTGLIVGAQCAVIESIGLGARVHAAPAGPSPRVGPNDTGFTWLAPVWTPAPPTFTVPATGQPAVTFTVTNAIARGAFTITKTVIGSGAPTLAFSGTWSCELPAGTVVASGTWSLPAGGTTTPITAPVGATCGVTETAPVAPTDGTWETPSVGPAVVITTGSATDPIPVSVTNTFAEASGSFSIVKDVDNPFDLAFPDAFSGTWSCTTAGQTLDGTWALASMDAPVVIDGIPLGAECAVAEDTPPAPADGAWGTPVISPSSFTVDDDETVVAVTVTNTLAVDLGAFALRKVVEDPDGLAEDVTFRGTVTCTFAGETVVITWELAGGEESDPVNVPVGSECTVAEIRPEDPAAGTWGEPVIDPASFVVEDTDAARLVTVTNTLRAVLPITGGVIATGAAAVALAAVAVGILLLLAPHLRPRRRGHG